MIHIKFGFCYLYKHFFVCVFLIPFQSLSFVEFCLWERILWGGADIEQSVLWWNATFWIRSLNYNDMGTVFFTCCIVSFFTYWYEWEFTLSWSSGVAPGSCSKFECLYTFYNMGCWLLVSIKDKTVVWKSLIVEIRLMSIGWLIILLTAS